MHLFSKLPVRLGTLALFAVTAVAAVGLQAQNSPAAPSPLSGISFRAIGPTAQGGRYVDYAVVEETGPPHDRHFVIAARVKGREVGRGEGRTKKTAEQEAAAQGLAEFDGGGD